MSTKRSMQAQYEFLSLPAIQNGIDSLDGWERLALAALYVKEVRKRTFEYSGADDAAHLTAFLHHVQEHFATSDDLKVVLDFQPRLLASARDLSHKPRPIEALILYATWCEHWLNATLITAGLSRRLGEEDVYLMVRESSIVKVGWLWRLLDLPPLSEQIKKRLLLLADIRNEHVHYKWKGFEPDLLETTPERLQLAVSDAKDLVDSLVDWEIETLLAGPIATADRLFKVALAPEWRSLALTRPVSAGDPPRANLHDV